MRWSLICILLIVLSAKAAPWDFEPTLEVSRVHGDGVFHHLRSAGRKNIATSGRFIAVVWEDNRDGHPRCYAAFRSMNSGGFEADVRISGSGEAFEPAVVSIGDRRFAVTWEEDGRIWVRIIGPANRGRPLRLGEEASAQPSLAFSQDLGLYVVWSQGDRGYSRIRIARLKIEVDSLKLSIDDWGPVELGAPQSEQLYPSLAISQNVIMVAWEDRRRGHTVIMCSSAKAGQRFGLPSQMNESFWGGRAQGYGRGTGAMRVALAGYGYAGIVAVWLDKRNFLSGYDVYAAFANKDGTAFGVNQKVQDVFGNEMAQWYPAIAAHDSGLLAVAWNDDRDDTQDIWLSWHTRTGWSEDMGVPGAADSAEQIEPSLTLDTAGNLHLVWLVKPELEAPTRIRYVIGRLRETHDK